MINKFYKIIFSLVISSVLGCVCGYLFFDTYKKMVKSDNVIYMIESNTYDSVDSMKSDNLYNDYTYYVRDNTYYKVVGFTLDKSIISNNSNLKAVKCYVNDSSVYDKIHLNDIRLENASNDDFNGILSDSIGYFSSDDIELYRIYS